MKSRAILIGGIGMTTLAAAAAMLAPPAEPDFTSLPPESAEVQAALRASPMTLAEALDKVRAVAPGQVQSIELFPDRSPPQARALVYRNGSAEWITLDLAGGEAIDRSPHERFPGVPVTGEGVTTEEGLTYFDIKVGEGEAPPHDNIDVTLHWAAYLIDGKKVDDTHARGTPPTIALKSSMEGWTIGIRTMRVGGKRKLVVPPALAFGEAGRPPAVPPNSIIVCDMELLGFRDMDRDFSTVPDVLPGVPVAGEPVVTESGLMYYDLVVGDGAQPSGPDANVKVHYTGWTNDGHKFDSSLDNGMPASLSLGGVIPGWTEGVGSMRVGGKRKLVIPFELAYGERGRGSTIPPKALLIFDIELLEVLSDNP